MRTREMRGYPRNHPENLGMKRMLCGSQFIIPNTAGTSSNLSCNHIDTRSSEHHHASYISDFSYPLVSFLSLWFSSTICLFLVHNSTIMDEHKGQSSLCISQCQNHELTLSTVYTKYSIQQVQHTPKMVCLPYIVIITSWPLNLAWASGVPPYLINCHSLGCHAIAQIQ